MLWRRWVLYPTDHLLHRLLAYCRSSPSAFTWLTSVSSLLAKYKISVDTLQGPRGPAALRRQVEEIYWRDWRQRISHSMTAFPFIEGSKSVYVPHLPMAKRSLIQKIRCGDERGLFKGPLPHPCPICHRTYDNWTLHVLCYCTQKAPLRHITSLSHLALLLCVGKPATLTALADHFQHWLLKANF